MKRWVAGAVAAILAGCGGSAALSAGARSTLNGHVAAIKSAVANDDQAGATAALAGLRTAVAQLESQHAISGSRAAAILSAAVEVEAQLPTMPTTTTTTTLPPAPPDTAPPPPARHHKGGPGGDG